MNPIKSAILGMALLAVADVYAGEQCCRQGGNLHLWGTERNVY